MKDRLLNISLATLLLSAGCKPATTQNQEQAEGYKITANRISQLSAYNVSFDDNDTFDIPLLGFYKPERHFRVIDEVCGIPPGGIKVVNITFFGPIRKYVATEKPNCVQLINDRAVALGQPPN